MANLGNNSGMTAQGFSLSAMSSPTQIVDELISEAIRQKASDILLEPQEGNVQVRLRVDGLLKSQGEMSLGAFDQVLSRIKVLGNMDVTESRKPQEAKIRVEVEGHAYVLRVAIVTTNFGQMAALRVLDLPQYTELGQLGVTEEMAKKIKDNISGRYGLFLVCGPTGSGKTTTVDACLKYLNTGDMNIMTLEDPVEYLIPGINQIEVSREIGMDFVNSLKMVLRLNPDVVFVGEIRDMETAKIAIQAALTGHLVISTIHSRDSIGALYRLVDLGIDRYMLNYALRAILSQRLMRRICEHCKQEYHPSEEEMAMFEREKGNESTKFWHGAGCEWCSKTHYKGRVGIFELLEMNEAARNSVASGVGEVELRKKFEENGYVGMDRQGIKLVEDGVTSLSEFLRTMYDAR